MDRRNRAGYAASSGRNGILRAVHPEATTADWIEAVAAVFAAIGTVGAVMVALWQTWRQGQRRMRVQCRLGVTPDERVVTLRGINEGAKAIEITMAYLSSDTGQTIICTFYPGIGDNLIGGKLVLEGQSVEVVWKLSLLGQTREQEGFKGYQFAHFVDTLGNVYADTFPGTRRRHNLNLRWSWRPLRRSVVYTLPSTERDPFG
jgi:hypothetical protein